MIKEDVGGINFYLLELKIDNFGICVCIIYFICYGVYVCCIKDID